MYNIRLLLLPDVVNTSASSGDYKDLISLFHEGSGNQTNSMHALEYVCNKLVYYTCNKI